MEALFGPGQQSKAQTFQLAARHHQLQGYADTQGFAFSSQRGTIKILFPKMHLVNSINFTLEKCKKWECFSGTNSSSTVH